MFLIKKNYLDRLVQDEYKIKQKRSFLNVKTGLVVFTNKNKTIVFSLKKRPFFFNNDRLKKTFFGINFLVISSIVLNEF